VITRSDLPPGFLAAQIVHAAGESSPGTLSPGTYAVVLSVPSEEALLDTERRLQKAGVPHVSIREPDAPWNGQLTVIGLVPTTDRTVIRKLTSSLPLYGKEPRVVDVDTDLLRRSA
jgi:peptidyl-tRNA hydrolase